MSESHLRIEQFLRSRGQSADVQVLTADASTREYYRINWDGKTAIACVYPELFEPANQSFFDVTRLFLASGLPVADVMDFDGPLGIIVQEDLGDQILRDRLATADDAERARLIDEAISLIARIQAATANAFRMGSIASKLKFDREKLLWELDYFKEHYFTTMLDRPLSAAEDTDITKEFEQLAVDLESKAAVLTHRDFHSANLMIDHYGRMRIIDHQDARIGSVTYDLVSLLLDRVTEAPPKDWLKEKQAYFLTERSKVGLPEVDLDQFAQEFRLQTVQRCLKAAGTFSYQSTVRGKTHFIPFIKPMLALSFEALGSSDLYPALKQRLAAELTPDQTF